MKRQITPHLWFDTQAVEAAEFYAAAFPDARITHKTTLHDTPSGDCDVVSFEIAGQPFMAISAGPLFEINPSISFFVNFDPSRDDAAREHLDALWEKLADGGKALMALGEYPFSPHYGWIEDRYGVSWQLMLTDPEGDPRPFIIPSLLFVGDVAGKAEEATDHYLSVFEEAERGQLVHYPPGTPEAGSVMFTDLRLLDTWIAAMDSAHPGHEFSFNEAVSLVVQCDTQEEIDHHWERLSAVPEAEQCGWCRDRWGVSWQVVPAAMNEMLENGSREQIDRVTQAFLPMKKFDLEALRRAYEG